MKKNLKLLLVSMFLLPAVMITAQAQDVTLQKHVIGSGGSVGQTITTDDGKTITLSGTVAQTAVETKEVSGGAAGLITLYEGIWTLEAEPMTNVEDEETTSNSLSNYPNPFNGSTNIQFSLEQAANVTIRVYDINGSLVGTVINNETMQARESISIPWDAKDQFGTPLSSGSYLYELSIEPMNGRSFSLRNVMVIVK